MVEIYQDDALTPEQVATTVATLKALAPTLKFSSQAQALGKRANTVSGVVADEGHKDSLRARSRRRMDAQEMASKGGRAKQVVENLREKDQPLHVRLRVARLRRFQMQDTAARLAGEYLGRDNRARKDRVGHCLRVLTNVASGVECRYVPGAGSAHYRGLQTCGSVWHCPVCAARISERRRDELARIVAAHVAAGGSVWMTTYTVAHKKADDLAALVEKFLAARRKMRMGRRGIALRECFGVIGTVSVLEVTWSPRHGWHPHVHELVFSSQADMNPDAYEALARVAWKDAAGKMGLKMNAHGFKIDRTFGAVADYIAKFGHEPESKHVWGVESEVAKGHVKQSRDKDGMTPFGLLAAATDGLDWAAPLWQEFCRVFKGRKQLNYSPGLKAMYQVADETDEEIASAGETQEAVTLVELSPAQWDQVTEAAARGGVLELTRTGRPGYLVAGLAEIGIETAPVDMVGWRVSGPDGPGEVDYVGAAEHAPGGWRIWIYLDGPGSLDSRLRVYPLWDVEVLSDGSQERAALLADVS